MGVGKGGGAKVPLDFENFIKKGCFPSFEWEKAISPLLGPPRRILEKNPSAFPPGKNPSDAHGSRLLNNSGFIKLFSCPAPNGSLMQDA